MLVSIFLSLPPERVLLTFGYKETISALCDITNKPRTAAELGLLKSRTSSIRAKWRFLTSEEWTANCCSAQVK